MSLIESLLKAADELEGMTPIDRQPDFFKPAPAPKMPQRLQGEGKGPQWRKPPEGGELYEDEHDSFKGRFADGWDAADWSDQQGLLEAIHRQLHPYGLEIQRGTGPDSDRYFRVGKPGQKMRAAYTSPAHHTSFQRPLAVSPRRGRK